MDTLLILRLLLFLLLLLHGIQAAPVRRRNDPDDNPCNGVDEYQAKLYLGGYGYLDKPVTRNMAAIAERLRPAGALPAAYRRLQKAFGLPTSGVLDEETCRLIRKARCGRDDLSMIQHEGSSTRTKRYLLWGTWWNPPDVTYHILNYTPDLPQATVVTEIDNAFQKWQAVAQISFNRIPSNAKIEMLFATGDHGDGVPFDGQNGMLAHAAFPPASGSAYDLSGDVHYDEDERWIVSGDSGFDFRWVSLHEIGHAIGLDHTTVKDAIMFPTVNMGTGPDPALHTDDIFGVQALYGARASGCPIDAAFTVRVSSEMYTIKDDILYTYTSTGDLDPSNYLGAESLAAALPDNTPTNIVAAMDDSYVYRSTTGRFYLLSDTYMWTFLTRQGRIRYYKSWLTEHFYTDGSINPTAAFIQKCRISGGEIKRCIFIMQQGTTVPVFYQFLYSWRSRYTPVFEGDIVRSGPARPMPLADINDYLYPPIFPESFMAAGVNAVLELSTKMYFFQDTSYIAMDKEQKESPTSGSTSDVLSCEAGLSAQTAAAANFGLGGAVARSVTNNARRSDGAKTVLDT